MKNGYFIAGLLLIAGFKTTSVKAQTDFRPGYIVRLAGDTVRGEIDYRDARFNATQCRFRSGGSVAVVTFKPAELKGYTIPAEHKVYQSLALPTEGSTAIAAPTYFYEALVSGAANLYFLRGEDRVDHLFVATASFPLTELLYRKVRVERDGGVFLDEQAIFRNTLALALANCPAAQIQLPTLPFNERSLAGVVATYNRCQTQLPIASATSTVAETASSGQHVHIGLLVGAKQTRLTIDGNPPYENLKFGPDTGPVAGLAINLPLTQFSRKLSLEVDVFYEMQKYNKATDSQPFPNYRAASIYKFDLGYLRMPLLVRYTFPKGLVRPFIEVGPTTAFALKTTNTVSRTISTGQFGAEEPVFDTNGGFRRFEIGVSAGVGIQTEVWQKRRATLSLRYEKSDGCSGYTGILTRVEHVYGIIALDLFK